MEATTLVLIGGLATLSGWVVAWRARGEANRSLHRSRIAVAKSDALVSRAIDAESSLAAAEGQVRAAAAEISSLRSALRFERATVANLTRKIETLQAGGDDLFESTTDRLINNGNLKGSKT